MEKEIRNNMTKNITVNEQSSIKIEADKIIYFDPLNLPAELHDADIIFITHEHHDHFSVADIAKIKKSTTILVAPATMEQMVIDKVGISPENCVFVSPETEYEIGGFQVETVPAYNKIKPFHTKGKKWCGYIVTIDNIRYYVAGDTDDISDKYMVKSDVAMIPVGGTFTMNVNEAVKFMSHIKPKVVIPTHYGTIVGKRENGREFKELMEKENPDVQVILKL